jgi:hypothetical protein
MSSPVEVAHDDNRLVAFGFGCRGRVQRLRPTPWTQPLVFELHSGIGQKRIPEVTLIKASILRFGLCRVGNVLLEERR